MIPALRAELRKLLTVRSTYVIVALCLGLTAFIAFYLTGYRSARDITDPTAVATLTTGMMQAMGLIISLAAVLLVTHEYRYNTIMYSLTSAASRSYVFLAKIICISLFAILLSLLVSILTPLLLELGLQAKGLTLADQATPFGELLVRCLLYGWASSMFALILAFIIRNQVGTIAVLLLLPGPGEALLSLILKSNAKYLPFNTLGVVLQNTTQNYQNALTVLLSYVVGGWLVAWLLFMRRDAN